VNVKIISILLLLWLPFSAISQIPALPRFDNLGITDGLSQSTVFNIIQDHLGFMWFCTEDGVNQYDGYHFKIFRNELDNPQSIANSQVFAVHEDRYRNLWFISTNGISRFNRDMETFDRILYKPSVITGSASIKIIEQGEECFFINNNIVYRLNGQTGKLRQERIPVDIKAKHFLLKLPDSTLLTVGTAGLFTYNPTTGRFAKFEYNSSGEINFIPKGCLSLSGNNYIYFDETTLVFADRLGRVRKRVVIKDGDLIGKARFDATGNFWISAEGGALCLDTTTLHYQIFSHNRGDANSLAGNSVRCIYLDHTGILWFGTNEGGVSRLAPHKIKFSGMGAAHDGIKGISANAILGFGEDAQHNIWMATDAASINIYNPADQSIQRLDKTNGCPFGTNNYLLTILVDENYAWCGHNNGVDIVSVKTRRIISSPLIMKDAVIKRIYKDSDGKIWACGNTAIYQYNEKTRRFDPFKLPVEITEVDDLIKDHKGNLWIGSSTGLIRYNFTTGKLDNYTLKYPEILGNSSIIGGFCMDSNGSLWFGAGERGLFRYNEPNDSFTGWDTKSGLPNNVLYATMADNKDNIWITTNAGVSRFNPATQRFTNFTVKDGLQSNEFIGRSILKDHSGRIYFGNIAGFNSILPEYININTNPPRAQITAFKVFDKEQFFRKQLAEKGRIELLQSQNDFRIEYSALDFTTPSENKYRVMLEGFDEGWRPLSTTHSVSYTNLDAGHYTFKVIAYNNDNVSSGKILELPIYIMPPFYKTWWFVTLLLCCAAGIITYLVRDRVQDIRRKSTARLHMSDLNRQITEYKLQALQAQMNPHFIFNSLNAIQSIIMQKDALRAAAYLADFSKLMRRILDNSHEQFVLLEVIVDTMKMYVHLEALRFNNEFTYEFIVDEDGLPMRELKLPPMLLQPYIENAILHGLMPKEGNKNLLVMLFEKDEKLHCIIEDNGVGRGKRTQQASHISRGEMLTKGIRDSLNNLLGITATITCHDLKEASGKASGTRIEIIVPIPDIIHS
jgi:ligand-binding sensor domain-containing protein